MTPEKEIALLKRRLEREIKARKQAEMVLENKALELYQSNQQLVSLNESLEQRIADRTKQLEASEKRYRQIVENATDIIYRADRHGVFTYANQKAAAELECPLEEIIGKHFTSVVHPDYREKVTNFYREITRKKTIHSYLELPIVTPSGETRWLGQNVQLIIINGEVSELTAVARDITIRKVTEDALASTQLRLTKLIANLQSGILVEDENGKIILTNTRFCTKFNNGNSPDALIGKVRTQSVEQARLLFKDPEAFAAGVEALVRKKQMKLGEVLELANGEVYERDFIPILVDDKYLGHLWQYRDVTKTRQAEEALRVSEEKYRGILENMELGLMEVDNESNIVRVYDHFCKMTGYEARELLGKNANEILLPKEFLSVMNKQNRDRLAGKAGNYEVQIICKNGERIWVLISGMPVYDQSGKVVGSVGIHYDVSQQKRLQQQLFEARLKAEEAKEAEKQFMANMSHEIRTPLNAIIGMTYLLYDSKPSPDQLDYLDILKNSAEILRLLINDLLDISKMRAGKMEVNEKLFDLKGLVETLQKTFQLKLEHKAIVVEAEIDPRLKNMVLGDDLLLNQILLNLLGNAEKFTEEGKIGVRVAQVERKGDLVEFCFEVFDTGIGIPQDKMDLIFQNFRQVDGDIKRRYGGTGLGLYIVKELIELQGGRIYVQSQLGKGTVFTFYLTYRDSGQSLAAVPNEANLLQTNFNHKHSVLVVEDNTMNQQYISSLFDKWNITYQMAMNGRQGVEMAFKTKFDLILMDIQMPEIDGYQATIALRTNANANQHTPIVALTASALISRKDKAFQVGMNDYVSKPFTPQRLLMTLSKFLFTGTLAGEDITIPAAAAAAKLPATGFQFSTDLDAGFLSDLYGGDPEYALDMFNAFFEKIELEFPLMQQHFKKGDFLAVSKLAHKIKPAFSMVGLSQLEKVFQTIEDSFRNEELKADELEQLLVSAEASTRECLPLVKAEWGRLQEACRQVAG